MYVCIYIYTHTFIYIYTYIYIRIYLHTHTRTHTHTWSHPAMIDGSPVSISFSRIETIGVCGCFSTSPVLRFCRFVSREIPGTPIRILFATLRCMPTGSFSIVQNNAENQPLSTKEEIRKPLRLWIVKVVLSKRRSRALLLSVGHLHSSFFASEVAQTPPGLNLPKRPKT